MERCPNLKEEVGGWIPGCEISSLLDKNLPGGQLPHMLWRGPINLFVSKKNLNKENYPPFESQSCERSLKQRRNVSNNSKFPHSELSLTILNFEIDHKMSRASSHPRISITSW